MKKGLSMSRSARARKSSIREVGTGLRGTPIDAIHSDEYTLTARHRRSCGSPIVTQQVFHADFRGESIFLPIDRGAFVPVAWSHDDCPRWIRFVVLGDPLTDIRRDGSSNVSAGIAQRVVEDFRCLSDILCVQNRRVFLGTVQVINHRLYMCRTNDFHQRFQEVPGGLERLGRRGCPSNLCAPGIEPLLGDIPVVGYDGTIDSIVLVKIAEQENP